MTSLGDKNKQLQIQRGHKAECECSWLPSVGDTDSFLFAEVRKGRSAWTLHWGSLTPMSSGDCNYIKCWTELFSYDKLWFLRGEIYTWSIFSKAHLRNLSCLKTHITTVRMDESMGCVMAYKILFQLIWNGILSGFYQEWFGLVSGGMTQVHF